MYKRASDFLNSDDILAG